MGSQFDCLCLGRYIVLDNYAQSYRSIGHAEPGGLESVRSGGINQWIEV